MRDTIEINDQKITVIKIISWWQKQTYFDGSEDNCCCYFHYKISECGHNFGIT